MSLPSDGASMRAAEDETQSPLRLINESFFTYTQYFEDGSACETISFGGGLYFKAPRYVVEHGSTFPTRVFSVFKADRCKQAFWVTIHNPQLIMFLQDRISMADMDTHETWLRGGAQGFHLPIDALLAQCDNLLDDVCGATPSHEALHCYFCGMRDLLVKDFICDQHVFGDMFDLEGFWQLAPKHTENMRQWCIQQDLTQIQNSVSADFETMPSKPPSLETLIAKELRLDAERNHAVQSVLFNVDTSDDEVLSPTAMMLISYGPYRERPRDVPQNMTQQVRSLIIKAHERFQNRSSTLPATTEFIEMAASLGSPRRIFLRGMATIRGFVDGLLPETVSDILCYLIVAKAMQQVLVDMAIQGALLDWEGLQLNDKAAESTDFHKWLCQVPEGDKDVYRQVLNDLWGWKETDDCMVEINDEDRHKWLEHLQHLLSPMLSETAYRMRLEQEKKSPFGGRRLDTIFGQMDNRSFVGDDLCHPSSSSFLLFDPGGPCASAAARHLQAEGDQSNLVALLTGVFFLSLLAFCCVWRYGTTVLSDAGLLGDLTRKMQPACTYMVQACWYLWRYSQSATYHGTDRFAEAFGLGAALSASCLTSLSSPVNDTSHDPVDLDVRSPEDSSPCAEPWPSQSSNAMDSATPLEHSSDAPCFQRWTFSQYDRAYETGVQSVATTSSETPSKLSARQSPTRLHCSACNKSFSNKGNLNKHLETDCRKTTGKQRFPCGNAECARYFSRPHYRDIHKRKCARLAKEP